MEFAAPPDRSAPLRPPGPAAGPVLRRWWRPSGRSSPANLLLALLVVLVTASACVAADEVSYNGNVLSPRPDVSAITLPDASAGGQDFAIKADDGELLLVYFGYTSCPDVCPTTLFDVSKAVGSLDEQLADRIDLAMVTIDPARDTGEVLTGYVQSFLDDAHALVTEDDARLRAATDAFGANYSIGTDPEGRIDVIHTGSVYGVNDQGEITVVWPFGVPSSEIGADLALLVNDI